MDAQIALLPGDGIGPEIVAEAVKVLEALRGPGFTPVFKEAPVGAAAYLLTGDPLPPTTMKLARESDAVLFGAVGDPRFDHLERDLRPERAILGLRRELGLFASLKEVSISGGLAQLSPLRVERVDGLRLLVVRELNGDVYTGTPRGRRVAQDGLFAGQAEGFDTMRYSEGEVRRVAHIAFRAARERRTHVTNVDKANVLETSRLWREIVVDIGRDYPDVPLKHLYADNAVMQMMSRPTTLGVVLTGNLFGDILSDAAGVLSGSVGLCGSALLGVGRRGMYEAGHGTALDLAGRNRANPIACIRAAALLLRHSLGRADLASQVEAAVDVVLARGLRTADIAPADTPAVGTREMGSAVAAAVSEATANSTCTH
jgi:3-isopropylmalate dehydrogenase